MMALCLELKIFIRVIGFLNIKTSYFILHNVKNSVTFLNILFRLNV